MADILYNQFTWDNRLLEPNKYLQNQAQAWVWKTGALFTNID